MDFFKNIFSKKQKGAAPVGGSSFGSRKPDAQFSNHAYRDWQILSALFALAVIAIVFAGLVLFQQENSNAVFAEGQAAAGMEQAAPVFNQAALNTLMSGFQARAALHSSQESGAGAIPDPSL